MVEAVTARVSVLPVVGSDILTGLSAVKAGNLARWFPPWTVTREQWHSMSRPSVSGIAIDTFLFSRIGMPLFHRYRVFDRLGAHPAFQGLYMTRLFDFLKEADADSICRSHRRRAKEIAASMSKGAPSSKDVPTATTSSRRSVQRTPVLKITGREAGPSLIPTADRHPQLLASSIYRRSAEKDTVQALMDKVRKRDTQPLSQPVLIDGPATEPTPGERPVGTKTDSLMDKPPEAELPAWSDTEIMPLIIIDKSSVGEKLTTTDGLLPIRSEILLPRSPEMARTLWQLPCHQIG